jgi:hypothetical protein
MEQGGFPLAGFSELPIMEDFEFVKRVRRLGRIRIVPVLPKNSIRRLYHPTGHASNWVRPEKMARKNPGIPRESGCFTITRRPVATNLPDKPMPTITQHASTDDAIRRPAQWR